mmetsp:Transcript_65404/g.200297  ORF Transcript_65404/g.200297 Transcript_65404/m.200297 type:complete len:230 (+) Transcript_65404:556-1245(+)
MDSIRVLAQVLVGAARGGGRGLRLVLGQPRPLGGRLDAASGDATSVRPRQRLRRRGVGRNVGGGGRLYRHLLRQARRDLLLGVARQPQEQLHRERYLRLVGLQHLPQGLPRGEVDDDSLAAVQDRVARSEQSHVFVLPLAHGEVVLHVAHMASRSLAENLVAQKGLGLTLRVRRPLAILQRRRPSHQRVAHQPDVLDAADLHIGHLAPQHDRSRRPGQAARAARARAEP